jgi:hypothetical protein
VTIGIFVLQLVPPDEAGRGADHRRLLDQRHGGDLIMRENMRRYKKSPDRSVEPRSTTLSHPDDLGTVFRRRPGGLVTVPVGPVLFNLGGGDAVGRQR